jgi:EAL domain-containing protein (putative c-di-GMP-specific phosphodiesterase class I)
MISGKIRCSACRTDVTLPEFTMAFQPIVDIDNAEVYAFEALVRPIGGGTAHDILSQISSETRYAFDQACRVKAITLAARLNMTALLSINFLPNAVYQPAACLAKTFEAAARADFPLHHLMFEVTENEPSRDVGHLQDIFTEYKSHGMITAIDDFGAGHSGLNMLADFQPDVIKIDMALTRAINTDPIRYEIARAVIDLCARLHISVVAEGVETLDEAVALHGLGVHLFQGHLFARPGLERLPTITREPIDAIHAAHEAKILDPHSSAARQVHAHR